MYCSSGKSSKNKHEKVQNAKSKFWVGAWMCYTYTKYGYMITPIIIE